jgi:hypothetical protein
MRHKAQYSTPQLRKLQLKGQDVFPVFGRPVDMVNLRHSPRTKFDPRPWVWGSHVEGLRYSAWELTTEPHKPTEGELAELRHEVEDTTNFSTLMARAAGVVA